MPEMNSRKCWKNSYSVWERARKTKQFKTSIIKKEHDKLSKLLNDSTVSKFVTRKWIEVNDLSNGQYSTNKNISFKIPMLIPGLCNCSYAYIVVKGTLTDTGTNNAKKT